MPASPEPAAREPPRSVPQVGRFLQSITPFKEIWKSARFAYSAVRQAGEWRNLFSTLHLDWAEPDGATPERLVDSQEIRVGSTRLARDAAIEFVARAASESAYLIDGLRIRLDTLTPTNSGGTTTTLYGWTPWRLDGNNRRWNLNVGDDPNVQGYALQADGNRAADLLTHAEWLAVHNALLAAEEPVAGIPELTTGYLGFDDLKTINHMLTLEVTARFASQITEWSVDQTGQFQGRIQCPPTIAEGDLDVAAIMSRGGEYDRIHVPALPSTIQGNSGLAVRTFGFRFQGYDWVELHLMLKGWQIHHHEIRFPSPNTENPRARVLPALGRVGELLTETLDQSTPIRSSERFEQLVGWILHLAGFQVMQTDFPPMKGGEADLIAFDPYSQSHLVIEVTARDPLNNEKLSKLRRRTDDIRATVPTETFYAVAIVPDRDSFLPTEIATATQLGVGLLSKPDLNRILEMAGENHLPARILSQVVLKRAA